VIDGQYSLRLTYVKPILKRVLINLSILTKGRDSK